jgi:serine/threonine protein kinase
MDIILVAVISPVHFTPKNMPATNELLQEGRYRITQEFAHDGSDIVYDAFDTVREANVIVKEIPVRLNKVATLSQRETQKLAFANQAKLLTEIDHESLLHVHDFFSEIDRQYLVMEAVDGDDLNELLERNNSPFDTSDVIGWADQLLDALNYLHAFKPPIIHRNIKPANVKLSSNGKIKLLAFGLADGPDTTVGTMLPDTNADQSNLRYSPLEQIWQGLDAASQKVITNSYDERSERILKEPSDARSDIYSLGATLYRLITAQEPIDALERSIEVLEGKADPLKEPRKVDPRIPAEISDVLMKAMEIKRENRFDSALIMRQVLRTAVVRVKEREAEDNREQEEAAEDIKLVEQTRLEQVRNIVEQKRLEIEAEQKQQSELLEQKLREADEQRIQAEQRAAAAENLVREKEALKAAQTAVAAPSEDLEDEILELHENVSVVFDDSIDTKAEETPFFEEIRVEAVYAKAEETPFVEEIHVEAVHEVVAYEEPSVVHFEPAFVAEPSVHESEGISFGGDYSYEAARSSLPIPAIAGGVVALLVVVAGIWMFMSSGPSPAAQPAPVQTVQQEVQPVAAETNTDATIVDDVPITVESSSASVPDRKAAQNANAQAQAQAKAKKAEADKAKAASGQKKAVTVDDLINDN